MQMDPGFASLIISFAFMIFLICFIIYTVLLVYSALKGSPYVPTNKKVLAEILGAAKLKPGMKMLELGCGDGRTVIEAVRRYGVTGYGIDINPVILERARWNARALPKNRIKFATKNLRDINVKPYDVTYLFLLPELLAKYAPKWEREAKKNALFISHAFTIKRWEKFLEKKVAGKKYDTYYYRVK